ncbi:hypothetical protein AC249_AIPGENE4950 [Exaiptasia diaphana]|nr:hypothetical protein AC249_AIPGENE4950 [Exaiptasia diaphana]
MASVPVGGQLYARIVSQKIRLGENQSEGGHSIAKAAEAITQGNGVSLYGGLSSYLPLARLYTVSACSAEKLPVDLDKDLKYLKINDNEPLF